MAQSKNPQRFTVTGAGRFPMDMLRYDACWPASSADARTIEKTFQEPSVPGEPIEITLMIAPGYTDPTAPRWASFGWYVGTVR